MAGMNIQNATASPEDLLLKHMSNISCIYHRLAVEYANSTDQLIVFENFEGTIIQLSIFFNNSPKMLNIYAKTGLKMHDLDTLPKGKHRKVVRKV